METPDVMFDADSSMARFRPTSEAGREWIKENVYSEPWQWFGDSLCVDIRFAHNLIEGMRDDGLVVNTD